MVSLSPHYGKCRLQLPLTSLCADAASPVFKKKRALARQTPASPQSRPKVPVRCMKPRTVRLMILNLIAVAMSAILAAVAALHLYWAAGGLWPGRTPRELIDTVIGNPRRNEMPPAWLSALVGIALAATAMLPLIIAPLSGAFSSRSAVRSRALGSNVRRVLCGPGFLRTRHRGLPAILAPPSSRAAVRDPGCAPLLAAMPAVGRGVHFHRFHVLVAV